MLSLDPDFITAGNGSDELISVITSAFLMKGERVLTLLPDFSMYSFYASVSENEVISLKKNDSLEIDIDSIIDAANNQNARMIIFSNPCNPTGRGFYRQEVRKLITSVKALVVLDEAYMDFWDQSMLSEVSQYDNLIILKTFSKAFGMAALRLGFAVACPKITNALRAVKSPYNVNTITQTVACRVLDFPDQLRNGVKAIIKSRDELYTALKHSETRFSGRIEVFQSFTNFVVVKTDEAKKIFEFLLANSVAVRFIGGFLRITAGNANENATVVSLINEYLEG